MIRSANTSPIPGSLSSSSAEAVLTLIRFAASLWSGLTLNCEASFVTNGLGSFAHEQTRGEVAGKKNQEKAVHKYLEGRFG